MNKTKQKKAKVLELKVEVILVVLKGKVIQFNFYLVEERRRSEIS